MTQVMELLRGFFTEAWTALAGALFVFVSLGLLAQFLRSGAAMVIGSRYGWANALGSVVSLLLVSLFGVLGVPVLARAAASSAGLASCGPLAELGASTAQLLAAIGGIRMLWTIVRSTAGLAVGAPGRFGDVFSEAGETVFGMLLISAAGPAAAYFLGIC